MLSERNEKISTLQQAIGKHENDVVEEILKELHNKDYPALLEGDNNGKKILSSALNLKNLHALMLYINPLKPIDKLNALNQTNKNGLTPLHIFLKNCTESNLAEALPFINLLISSGTNITITSNKNKSSLKLLSRFEEPKEKFLSSIIKGFSVFDDNYKLKIIERLRRAFMLQPSCPFRQAIYTKCAMLSSLQLGLAACIEVEKGLIIHIQRTHLPTDNKAFTPENLKTVCSINTLELLPLNLSSAARILKDRGDNDASKKVINFKKSLSPSPITIGKQPLYVFQRREFLKDDLSSYIREIKKIIEYVDDEDEYSLNRKLLAMLILFGIIAIDVLINSLAIYYATTCEKSSRNDCTITHINLYLTGALGILLPIPLAFCILLANCNVPALSNTTKRPKLSEKIYQLDGVLHEFASANPAIQRDLYLLTHEFAKIKTKQTVGEARTSFNNILTILKRLREQANITDIQDENFESKESSDHVAISMPHDNILPEFDIGPSTSGSNDIELTTYKVISSIDDEGKLAINRKSKKRKEKLSLFSTRREAEETDEIDDEEKQLLSSSNSP